MISEDYRLVVGLKSAERLTKAPFGKPRGHNPAAIQGLRYETRVGKQLGRFVAQGHLERLEHTPWFAFNDTFGRSACAPDFLLWVSPTYALVIEVKLTWVGQAMPKLRDLYQPVLERALGPNVTTNLIVICRNLTPSSPPAQNSIIGALGLHEPLVHWPDVGQIAWR